MHGLTLVVARPPASIPEPDRLCPVHALLEVLTEGASFRPRVAEPDALPLLCDLAAAAETLASHDRTRATVRVPSLPEPWDMGVERAGQDVLITLFQGSGVPDVSLHERRLDGDTFAAHVLDALRVDPDDAVAQAVAERLSTALPFGPSAGPSEPESFVIEPTGDLPIVMAAEVFLRPPPEAADTHPAAVLRADLFSLLFRGRLRITVGDHVRELPELFVFPAVEQLTAMAIEAVEAWTRGRPYYRRLTVCGAILGIKLERERGASLTLGVPRRREEARAATWTFPAVDISALAQALVAFGRAMVRSLTRRDRTQSANLRLHALRAKLRELSERLRDATKDESKINESPERYRAFAATVKPPPSAEGFERTRLRFSARWLSAVPSIDLRATFLCGDRIVVGAAREITCLDASTGLPLWQRSCSRAVSVMTPLGLARLAPDGELALLELSGGEPSWTTRLAPRVGTTAAGAVVSAPGLPRMLIVSEGTRHIAAVDLHGGEIKWRFAARRGGVFRLKRAGKLVIAATGDPALTALDVLSGEVVWRYCDRLRFASAVAVDHDALFAIAGAGAVVGRGGARLHHIDPWSGKGRWSVDIPERVAPVGAPLLGPETAVVVTHGRDGTGLLGFDRRTGDIRFEQAATGSAASCMIVDGTVIVNGEGGELVGLSASDGATRYRHVFSGSEGDRPRRLEPVLRSGALFVPQSEVQVVRPRDGVIIGKVPNDIIPDLLRVGERCDVYVAEESGHLGAYEAGPRLTLVRS